MRQLSRITKVVGYRVKRRLDHAQIDQLKQAELQTFIDQLQIGVAQMPGLGWLVRREVLANRRT